MRAKFVLAATLLLSALQPVFADDLVRDVHETLYRPIHHGLLGGLLGARAGACEVLPQAAVIDRCNAGCTTITQPAVVANTSCGPAILTRDPMDLDQRREQLQRRIAELSACGRLNACQVQTLGAALSEVNQAELAMRSQGELSNLGARRLYKAMDRIGSHTDRWSHSGYGLGAMIGLNSGFWY